MPSSEERSEAAYDGVEHGTCVNNADPLMIGRVKVRIPGLIDESEWCFPLIAGGSAQRGRWQIPKVGSDVTVWMHRGDPHGNAFYAPGHWGVVGGKSEAPTFISGDPTVTPANAAQLTGVEDDRYYAVIDSRPGKEAARIVDKQTGDKFELDGHRMRATIVVTGTLAINAGAIEMTAARILLNGRSVVPFGGPIA